ncbi:MAG: Spx/MgsR family RNA polymerase-binding regulatory protein [Nevskiaceae bacterium]|nr:MAG: Spx/MgsR family RNA polymerase-binding regulatory protein [Nevskiaceae bacterium]
MVVVYGIRNCDTVQRARERLDAAGIAYRFHDFKAQGLSPELAQTWIAALGMDAVVNRKGTTWRRLDQATRESLDARTAAALLSREPSLVKRPVIAWPGGLVAGFAKGDEAAILERLR